MLQVLAKKFRRCVWALVLPVVVLAAPTDAFAAVIDLDLHKAAIVGDAAEVERLLASGANINFGGGSGKTALYLASKFNRVAVVELLLAKGAALDGRGGDGACEFRVSGTSRLS